MAIIHAANIQDRDGGILLMAALLKEHPLLRKLYADGGYQGSKFYQALRRILRKIKVGIVKRSDATNGFTVLPRRWVVERTIAWLNRCRRLAKDWECLDRNARAFLQWASVRSMLRRLCKVKNDPEQTLWPCLALLVNNPCYFAPEHELIRQESLTQRMPAWREGRRRGQHVGSGPRGRHASLGGRRGHRGQFQ